MKEGEHEGGAGKGHSQATVQVTPAPTLCSHPRSYTPAPVKVTNPVPMNQSPPAQSPVHVLSLHHLGKPEERADERHSEDADILELE